MFMCPECKKEVDQGKFCGDCGKKSVAVVPPESPPQRLGTSIDTSVLENSIIDNSVKTQTDNHSTQIGNVSYHIYQNVYQPPIPQPQYPIPQPLLGAPFPGNQDPILKAPYPNPQQLPSAPQINYVPSSNQSTKNGQKAEFKMYFWESLLELAKERTNLHRNTKPCDNSYVSATVKKCLKFVYYVLQDGAQLELYIDSGDNIKNKAIYDSLYKLKDPIEKAFGGELVWQRLDDKKACRIKKVLPDVGSYKDQRRWPEIQKSMIDAMVQFEAALMPYIMELDI